jgi:hypothetical protein
MQSSISNMWNFIKKHKILIGAIWGISTTLISLYLGFFPPEKESKLTIYQKAKLDVFTLQDPIDELQILIHGKNIRKDSLNLKVYKLKLINDGDRDIKANEYAKPLYLKIDEGYILKTSLSNSSDPELSKSFVDKQNRDSTIIKFNNIFIAKKDFVIIDLWVMHKKNIDPELHLQGKIADTEITLTAEEEDAKSGWLSLLEMLGIIIVLIVGGAFILFILALVGDFIREKIRKFRVKSKLAHRFQSSNIHHRLLVEIYSSYGQKKFLEVLKILKDSSRATDVYLLEKSDEQLVDRFKKIVNEDKVESSDKIKNLEYNSPYLEIVQLLMEEKIIVEEGQRIRVEPSFIKEIELFIKALAN